MPVFQDLPPTRFTKVAGSSVAYQVVGDGPIDLIWVTSWFSHIDGRWQEPRWHRFWSRLASFSRLIMYDRRGSGASDPLTETNHPTWEQWVEDAVAVLDAAGSRRAAVVASADAGPTGILFAATYPERTSSLVLVNSSARFLEAPDYRFGAGRAFTDEVIARTEASWGNDALVQNVVPSMADDPEYLAWWARYQRMIASPALAGRQLRMQLLTADVRSVLPAIRVPTLVLHRRGITLPIHTIEHGRYMADHIPGARMVELEGDDLVATLGDQDALIDEIQEFVTGVRPTAEPDRVLATVMFTDIVDSTKRVAELGDREWRNLLDNHNQVVHRELDSFAGKVVRTTGDGILATFPGPARAIRCAASLRGALQRIGIGIRTGVHTGEVELLRNDLGGIAVHTAARIMTEASAGEVLVSSTVRDLVMGSGIEFDDRGTHQLKGVPGAWQLLAARV